MTRQEEVMNLMGVKGKCPSHNEPCPKTKKGECRGGRMSIWKAIDDPETGKPVDSLECDNCGLFVTVRVKTPTTVTRIEES